MTTCVVAQRMSYCKFSDLGIVTRSLLGTSTIGPLAHLRKNYDWASEWRRQGPNKRLFHGIVRRSGEQQSTSTANARAFYRCAADRIVLAHPFSTALLPVISHRRGSSSWNRCGGSGKRLGRSTRCCKYSVEGKRGRMNVKI